MTGASVTIVIPCYNYAYCLADAVESVVAQTSTDLDCVIVDDGSPDDTAQVAQRLIDLYPERRIQLVRQMNGGLSAARNAGIAVTQSTFVLPLDADDILAPQAVERMKAAFDEDPGLSVVYGCGRQFGDTRRRMQTSPIDITTIWSRNCPMYSSMITRDAWLRAGGYDSNMKYGYEDWNLWITILEQGGRFEQLQDEFLYYRQHGRSMLADANDKRLWLRARMVLNHPGLRPQGEQQLAQEILAHEDREMSPQLKLRVVTWLLRLGAPDDAIELCEWLLTSEAVPENPAVQATLHYVKGLGLSVSGCAKESIAALETAVRLQPMQAEYRRRLACSWLDVGELGLARAEIEDSLELDPHSQYGQMLTERIGSAEAALARTAGPQASTC